ncbi:MAG TPA: hypothetical protein PKD92_00625 [Novosphingobium sp.]|nr:hypothetical protein [Novosphingobium sp.]HMP55063.1 hypothetical protein [Novosphingobium sp.]
MRNLFNNRRLLERGLDQANLVTPQSALSFAPTTTLNSGYRSIKYVDAREFQLTLRYNFGSR